VRLHQQGAARLHQQGVILLHPPEVTHNWPYTWQQLPATHLQRPEALNRGLQVRISTQLKLLLPLG